MIAAISDLAARIRAFDAAIDQYGPMLAGVAIAMTIAVMVLLRPTTPNPPRAVWGACLGILAGCVIVGARHELATMAWSLLS